MPVWIGRPYKKSHLGVSWEDGCVIMENKCQHVKANDEDNSKKMYQFVHSCCDFLIGVSEKNEKEF